MGPVHPSLRWIVSAAALLCLIANAALAVDGVLEINQTCAVETGCFSGDTAGFPVTLSLFGNYVLTSDLSIRQEQDAANINAIELTSHVSLDLNGFGLYGPCTNLSPTTCTRGTGMGIRPIGPGIFGQFNVRVRNGRIVGMGSNAILIGSNSLVEGVQADNNGAGIRTGQASLVRGNSLARNQGVAIFVEDGSVVAGNAVYFNAADGIECLNACVVRDNALSRNDGDGISVPGGSVVRGNSITTSEGTGLVCLDDLESCGYSHNTFAGNVGGSVSGSELRATGGNACADHLCASGRTYYLTTTFHDGGGALTACVSGYHMAALWEILDTSNLEYEPSLGLTLADSGQGPPSAQAGWIRTGWPSSDNVSPGLGNCNAWTGTSGWGSYAIPRTNWSVASENELHAWITGSDLCSDLRHVWCIAD